VDQWVQERERASGSEQVVVESKSNRGWVIWCRTVVEGSQAKTNRAEGDGRGRLGSLHSLLCSRRRRNSR
jgi:hypothetical protein